MKNNRIKLGEKLKMRVIITKENIEEKIREAISYLLQKKYTTDISLSTLFEIRLYIKNNLNEDYSKRFPQTYKYEYGENCTFFEYDENEYLGSIEDNQLCINKCKYYGSKQDYYEVNPKIKYDLSAFKFNDVGYTYLYINEIDHFFSYYIVRYLRMKKGEKYVRFSAKDEAINKYMWSDLGIHE